MKTKERVKVFGHGVGFEQCPGARKWAQATVALITRRLPLTGIQRTTEMAKCPKCGRWMMFDRK